jgi:hypothetical protein
MKNSEIPLLGSPRLRCTPTSPPDDRPLPTDRQPCGERGTRQEQLGGMRDGGLCYTGAHAELRL